MSKKTRTRSQEQRRKQKSARKASQKALYESYMAQGKNTKSKRARKNQKIAAVRVSTVSHPQGKCGNPGCVKCFEVFFSPFLINRKPHRMPNWMWKKWDALSKDEQKRAVK